MTWVPTRRQLEYVVAVADTGRFGRAARATAVSQPALSKQIREVEEGLGVVLFERGARVSRPTSAGRELVDRARVVLAAARDLTDPAAVLRAPHAGRVRQGALPTLAPFVLPALVAAVAEELPGVELRLVEDRTHGLGERLARGELDVAVVALPFPRPGVSVLGLYDEPFHVAVPPGHPLDDDRPALPAEVARHPLLLLGSGHCLRDHALQACAQAPGAEAAVEASSLVTLLLMVQQGLGPTIVPEMALHLVPEGVRVRRFAAPVPTRGVGLWWRPSSPRAALYRRLGELLKAARPNRPPPALRTI